ncbi:MAG: type II toxin-antitoxin system RelE/ParE family toxin [Candidatus Latescibacteria bacterium]|nr:type II toxin-antitoxin system RelE/ParE family toxin [Candidatus Latescibacterota bacterium]
MIRSVKHRGLKRLHEQGNSRGVDPQHIDKIRRILFHLDTASEIKDMDAPGYGLHPLKGNRRGQWAVRVSANWRIIFRFEDGDCFDVDYVDYH